MNKSLTQACLNIGVGQINKINTHMDLTAQQMKDLLHELTTMQNLLDKLNHAQMENNGKYKIGDLSNEEKKLIHQYQPGFSDCPLTEHQRDELSRSLNSKCSRTIELEVKPRQNTIIHDEERKNLWNQTMILVLKIEEEANRNKIRNMAPR